MTVRLAILCTGRMGQTGHAVWLVVDRSGKQLGRPYASEAKARAALWQIESARTTVRRWR